MTHARQRRGYMHGNGGLPSSALFIADGNYMRHVFPLALPLERLFYSANSKACNNNLEEGNRGLENVNCPAPPHMR